MDAVTGDGRRKRVDGIRFDEIFTPKA